LVEIARTRNGNTMLSVPGYAQKFYVCLNTTDYKVMRNILREHEFAISDMPEPRLIVDCGAYTGYSSVYFAKTYPKATVIALEPERSNFGILLKNTAYYPNIIPINAAIWHKQALMDISDTGNNKESARIGENGVSSSKAIGITMDDVLSIAGTERIDLLKMDIEGSEREIMRHSQDWVNKVGIIIIELHDRFCPGCKEAFQSAVEPFSPRVYQQGEKVIIRFAGVP
jgi:FkbM family methyltransferase